jgi:apolipoprotein N-acyltransferase
MAVMRAVEHGFTLVRAARNGRVTVADAYGRILAEASTLNIPEASVLVPDAPAASIATVYARSGDWFGVLCCILAIGFAIRAAKPIMVK